jgi:hypothetical protein
MLQEQIKERLRRDKDMDDICGHSKLEGPDFSRRENVTD